MKDIAIAVMKGSLAVWNYVMNIVMDLLSLSPETFSPNVYNATISISGALTAIAYGLLSMFFVFGLFKSVSSYIEFKRPEVLFKALCRLAIVKGLIAYGNQLLVSVMNLGQGIISQAATAINVNEEMLFTFPEELANSIRNDTSITWSASITIMLIAILCTLIVIAIAFFMLLTIYSRFLKFYMYMAIAPIPLATYGGEPTQHVGRQFIKNYAGVCLEAFIIYMAVILGSAIANSTGWISINNFLGESAAIRVLWFYATIILNMLLVSGTAKAADRVVHEMMGL